MLLKFEVILREEKKPKKNSFGCDKKWTFCLIRGTKVDVLISPKTQPSTF